MKRLWLLALLTLPGCHSPPPPPSAPPLTHFLADPVDLDLEPSYDLLAADFLELNGSLALRLEFRNLTGRVPHLLARFMVENGTDSQEFFARNEADLARPAPHVRWEMGRVRPDGFNVIGGICAITSGSGEPWRIFLDLPHEWTGLVGGGAILGLGVETSDFENRTKDRADTTSRQAVRGGANPYEDCPLVAERPDQR